MFALKFLPWNAQQDQISARYHIYGAYLANGQHCREDVVCCHNRAGNRLKKKKCRFNYADAACHYFLMTFVPVSYFDDSCLHIQHSWSENSAGNRRHCLIFSSGIWPKRYTHNVKSLVHKVKFHCLMFVC